MRRQAVIAMAVLLPTLPSYALTCAKDFTHVELKKSQRKKIDRTLQAFFPYVDSIDLYAATIDSAKLEFNGQVYSCESQWKKIAVSCGPIQLNIATGSYSEREKLTIPKPLNTAYPFDYATYAGKEYTLISKYAPNRYYHSLRYKTSGPNWLAASNSASTDHCKTWRQIKDDSVFNHLVQAPGDYSQGRIVCIEDIECTENQSITTLSVYMSLVPLKYQKTLRSIGESVDDSNWSSWKEYLGKVNPLLARDELLDAKLTLVIASPIKKYNSPL